MIETARLPGRLLILGASGYVGSRLLTDLSADVVLGTYLHHPRPGLRRLDLADAQAIRALMAEFEPSVVLFVGGLIDVDACERSPHLARAVNADAVGVLAEAPDVRIVYFSTDYVFDGGNAPYAEHADRRPINVYGESKKEGEGAARRAKANNIVLRLSRVYGFSGTPGDVFWRFCARWCRGLMITDDLVIAGLTRIRRRANSRWCNRPIEETETSVLAFSRRSFQVVARVNLNDFGHYAKLFAFLPVRSDDVDHRR